MHPSSFGKRKPSARLISKERPPPLKPCLAASDPDRDSSPSGEDRVRKSVHFPDDSLLRRVRIIPPRDPLKKAIFKKGRLAETKSFIMYTSNSLGSNQRFLSRLPGTYGPQFTMYSHWMSIVRARRLAAAYCSEPGSPRSAPSSDGSVHDTVFDMSSLKDALPELHSSDSLHGSAFDMSSMVDALPDSDSAFDASSLVDALPDPDASSEVSPPAHVRKCAVAPHSRSLPPRVYTHVQVGPFSATCFFNLCGILLVLGCFFPWLAPAFYATLVLVFVCGMCFF
ncbi:unnamed protein product [Penicillium glandicola]